MFAFDHVSVRFGATQALDDVSLTIEPGATTVLIGSSGSGKSTLLRSMVGLVRPQSGSIRFEGQPLADSDFTALRTRIGYVIQDGGLFPHLDGQQNVCLLAQHLGRDADWIEARWRELAQMVQLPADALSKFPTQLSGGQRQRVALMRALMLDPDVLLLDEPLGALDPIIRADLRAHLIEIFAKLNKTVVFVTHDIREAAALGGATVLLHDGRIEQAGTIGDMAAAPATPFVQRFLEAQGAGR
ncbi:MAG: ATP-binding cassette domain-containing protein [Planctomycetes bacterium]|nr:ATP-binding cassette domain-containing protein [Planctomycetota bacterium]